MENCIQKVWEHIPDYREIEIPMKLSAIKSYLEPVLCAAGIVKDDEELLQLKFLSEHLDGDDPVLVKICLKKRQKVDTSIC